MITTRRSSLKNRIAAKWITVCCSESLFLNRSVIMLKQWKTGRKKKTIQQDLTLIQERKVQKCTKNSSIFDLWPKTWLFFLRLLHLNVFVKAALSLKYCPFICRWALLFFFFFVCNFWTSEHETNLPLTHSFLRALTSLTRSIRANTQKSIPAIN